MRIGWVRREEDNLFARMASMVLKDNGLSEIFKKTFKKFCRGEKGTYLCTRKNGEVTLRILREQGRVGRSVIGKRSLKRLTEKHVQQAKGADAVPRGTEGSAVNSPLA